MRLKRLYDAIEAGVADLDDPALKERIAGLKVIRDQAGAARAAIGGDWRAQRRTEMADGEGFEPPDPVKGRRFSRPMH